MMLASDFWSTRFSNCQMDFSLSWSVRVSDLLNSQIISLKKHKCVTLKCVLSSFNLIFFFFVVVVLFLFLWMDRYFISNVLGILVIHCIVLYYIEFFRSESCGILAINSIELYREVTQGEKNTRTKTNKENIMHLSLFSVLWLFFFVFVWRIVWTR